MVADTSLLSSPATTTVATPEDVGKVMSVRRLGVAALLMLLPLLLLPFTDYLGSNDLHSTMEVVGAPIGLVAGLTFILRFNALGERAHLFFGLAFFVNASADSLHGLLPFLVDRGVLDLSAEALRRFLPLSFLLGRMTAGLLLLVGPILVPRMTSDLSPGDTRRISGLVVLAGAAMSLLVFFFPIPETVFPDRLIGRPADLFTAFLYAPAAVVTYRLHRRTGDQMARWVTLSAMTAVVGQVVMGFSTELFDIYFDVAHAYKVVGYLLPLVGLSLYQVRLIAQRNAYAAELEARADFLSQANEQLERANAIKTEFVSVVSHELRTPLTAILGFASTMAEFWNDTPDEEKREHLGIIERQGVRLSRLINDLLAMSQLESGTLETYLDDLELEPMLARAVRDLGERGEHVEFEVPKGLFVSADPDHVEQIVVNFLTNASRYGAPPVVLRAWRDSDDVIVAVEDAGPGVPEPFRKHLFDKFAQADTGPTRRSQGTGLGLAIVQGLARAQGGEAWFEPNEPVGSRFLVRLKASTGESGGRG